MPIHDWTRSPAGYFHHFHQFWTVEICAALNAGRLPSGFFALVEQNAVGLVPDVLTLQQQRQGRPPAPVSGGLAVADAPPKTRFVARAEDDVYVAKANRIAIRTSAEHVVAVIEIVSPGNKAGKHGLRALVDKTTELFRQGINLLVVDLFPPSRRDPQGIHPLIWSAVHHGPFELPADKPLTLAAYAVGPPFTAYVEPVAVNDPLPDMPIFLDADTYVPVPLEATYQETWGRCPQEFREAVVTGKRL